MKQWLKSIFYSPKHTKPTDENILRLLMPSVAGIIVCMVCLAGMSWAWFTVSVQTKPQTITAGNYGIEVTVTDATGVPVDLTTPLKKGQFYTVILTAGGTAPSGGYCKVESGGKTLYTEPILPDQSLTFTLIPEQNGLYTFTGVWGKYSGEADITDDCTIERKPEVQPVPKGPETQQSAADKSVYTVQSGDSLWEIAQQYDTTVEKITAYNDIDRNAVLQIGQKIKIPPQDYKVPEQSVSSSPQISESKPENSETFSKSTESTVSTSESESNSSAEVSDNGNDDVTSE